MDASIPTDRARANRVLINPFLLDMPVPALRALAGDWVNDAEAVGATALDRVAALQRPLIERVQDAVATGERPVVIGADCCTPIAVLAGLSRAGIAPKVAWLDAHGDFNTPATSPSGFLGGMPLAMLVGRGDTRLLDAAALAPLAERDIILFDARELDPDESLALAASEIRHVRSLAALQDALAAPGPWHVHLDVDVVNLQDAPSVDFPAEGGPRLAELLLIGRALAARWPPVSVSLTTWDLDADRDGRTGRACLQLLDAWLGLEGAE